MSRSPRRQFAAPLILSIAAIPACMVSSKPSNDPNSNDHRGSSVEQRDHRGTGDDGGTGVITNPPRPDTKQTYEDSERWTIRLEADGGCLAYASMDCPDNAKCNPPRPSVVACPSGISANDPMEMWVNAGESECYVSYAGSMDCPEGASCNPPPPQKAECPQ